MILITTAIAVFLGQPPDSKADLVWRVAGWIPAERTHFTPGWTAGPFLYLMDRDSRDGWAARPRKDGTLPRWVRLKNLGFSRSKWSNPVVALGPRVYAFGHWGEARVSVIHPATGQPGPWKNAMKERGMGGGKEPLLWGGGVMAQVKRRRFLYHAGGFEYEGPNFSDPRAQNKVFYAAVLPNGLLSDWRQTTPLPYHPMGASAAVHQDRLYVFGGCAGRFNAGDDVVGMTDRIVSAPLRGDGTAGEWSALARPLPYRACGIAAFVRDGSLYIAGGETGGDGAGTARAFTNRFARAPLDSNGPGEWEELPPLPAATGKTPHGFIGDWFYIVGISKEGRTPVYGVRIAK